MHLTAHASQRMSQRGISKMLIDVVLQYGENQQDKVILSKRQAQESITQLEQQLRSLKKIADKGGVVVVASGNALITTYRYEGDMK